MRIDVQTIQNTFSNVTDFVIGTAKSIGQTIQSTNIPQYARQATEIVAQRVNAVWSHMYPILNALVAFAKTNLGIASMCLIGAFGAAGASKTTENYLTSGVFLVSSIALATMGGVFLVRANVIPPQLFAAQVSRL